MTSIGELFRREIDRAIEEVIKVDVDDEAVVAAEIDEYVVTDRIRAELEDVVREYVDSFDDRSDRTNVWVSGFFGSGKSSFAKVLGYLLENRVVAGKPAADRIYERVDSKELRALLSRAHDPKNRGTAVTTLVDLSSAHDVEAEEHVVLPIYRAVLQRLGYAREPKVAALEFDLETEGKLADFAPRFELVHGRPWDQVRHTTLAPNMASRVLHELDPATFPAADSWARGYTAPTVDADWFTRRAMEMVERRGSGARRLVIVVDEAGQYVARSRIRLLALQGLAQAVQKLQGRLFLVVTSQEKLEEVVDSLEGQAIELPRVRDRFPIRVDLQTSDIREVVGVRVLDKSDSGRRELEALVAPIKERLAANVRLASDRRSAEFSTEDFVRLYPLLPYQIQLLIDAVSQRRSQVRAGTPLGGSNRTIIRHAQQLLTNPRVGLARDDLGALVTLDRSYDLMVDLIDSGVRHQIDQVVDEYTEASTEAQVMKVVALVHGVRSLPLTAQNLAVLLHRSVDAESRRAEVEGAAARLVAAGWLRETTDGFQLQSAEQKQWDEKRQIELRPGDEVRERRRVLREEIGGRVSVIEGRTFKIGVIVDGETIADGEVLVELRALEESDDPAELVPSTRERSAINRIVWWFKRKDDTWEALREVFRSRTMIERNSSSSASEVTRQLVADERGRQRRSEAQFLERLRRDMSEDGGIVFQGTVGDPPPGPLKEALQAAVRERLAKVYSHLSTFAARIDTKAPLEVARTDDLAQLPASLGDAGIKLWTMTPAGPELVTDEGPLRLLVDEVRRRHDYGQTTSGQHLERHFGAPPYGAAPEVVQAVVAAALRAGLVELQHQGQRVTAATDRRLDSVFRGVAPFRLALVRPPVDTGPDLETRSRLAERVSDLTGSRCPVSLDELAARLRDRFDGERQPVGEAVSFLVGAGVAVPMALQQAQGVLAALGDGNDDGYLVSRFASGWDDLMAGLATAQPVTTIIADNPGLFTRAREAARLADPELPEPAQATRDRLRDLLDADDVVDRLPQVRALTDEIGAAHQRHLDEARKGATATLAQIRARLADEFTDVDDAVAEATLAARLGDLDPAGAGSVEQVLVRQALLPDAAEAVRCDLDAVRSDGRVTRIGVAEIVAGVMPEPIRTHDELDKALDAVRARALELLDDGKEVRLT